MHSKTTSRKVVLSTIYRHMLTSRRLDEKMMNLLRQGKSFFHVSAAGHEAAQVGAALSFKPGYDWCYPYYRDQAFVLTWGVTCFELLLLFLGRRQDPSSAGRQMPQHYGHAALRIVSQSSPTGTQYLQAVGTAMACTKMGTNEVVYVSSGEGATSQGDFYKAVNWATRDKLPVIFFIQDNNYAISVTKAQQTSGDSVYELVMGYAGLHRHRVDGLDALAVKKTVSHCVSLARQGLGPSLVVAGTLRLASHSSSDDQRKYRNAKELEAEADLDPLLNLGNWLLKNNQISQQGLQEIEKSIREEIETASICAENADLPDTTSLESHLFSNFKPVPVTIAESAGAPVVVVDAINHALTEEMERDHLIVLYGEDVADPKGGVFAVTRGLSSKFGPDRVFNSPLAESSIIGTAIGMAVRGLKPIVEIQFGDYIWAAMMQLRNEVTTLRWRSNGSFACPMIIRVAVGGYIHGALCHSQNIESFFAHLPGIIICYPCNAADAKSLLKQAIRGDDPVLFLEHKGLYRQSFATSPEPDMETLLPFGQACIKKSGKDISVITYGMMVHKSLNVAQRMATQKIDVEVIDLRTIAPLDWPTLLSSIQKTGRAVVVHEDTLTVGFGAEICAQISDKAFEFLDAPVKRVAALDLPVPYHPSLETTVLPNENKIETAILELVRY